MYVDLGTVQIATTELQLMTKYIKRNEMAINLWSVGNPDGLRQVQILIPQVQLWVQATSVLQYNYKLNIVCHQQAKDKDSIFKGRTNTTDVSQLNIFSICRLAASMCYR